LAKLKNKISASTLIEVVVAMMITILCFVIVSIFINQFLQVNNTFIKIKAYLILEEEILKTKTDNKYFDETLEYKNLKFVRNVYSYNKSDKLNIIHYKVLNIKKEILLEKKEVVPLIE
jgi:hypothetical protein